jgi:hypothetical protein
MSALQGPCDSEQHSKLLPDVWLCPLNVGKHRLVAEVSCHAEAPVEDLARLGLSESHHAPNGTNDSDRHPSQPSNQQPACDLNQVKRLLGLLLQTIETDLLVSFFPLLGRMQSTLRVPENFPQLAFLVWHVFQYTFKEVYPDHAAIWSKLSNGSFSFNWICWMRWADRELGLSDLDAGKPTALEINEFGQAWELLWEGLHQYLPHDIMESAVHSRATCLASWKTLADRFILASNG